MLAQNAVYMLDKCRREFARWAAEVGVERAAISRMGVRLVQLARAHSLYFYYASMLERVSKVRDECLRGSLFELTLLFGCSQIALNPNHLLESGLLQAHQLLSLKDLSEHLLQSLRADVLGYVDALGDFDLLRRSLIGTDSPDMYQHMLEEAQQRNCMNTHPFQVASSLAAVRECFGKL